MPFFDNSDGFFDGLEPLPAYLQANNKRPRMSKAQRKVFDLRKRELIAARATEKLEALRAKYAREQEQEAEDVAQAAWAPQAAQAQRGDEPMEEEKREVHNPNNVSDFAGNQTFVHQQIAEAAAQEEEEEFELEGLADQQPGARPD